MSLNWNITPVMYSDPSGNFAITIGMLLAGIAISASLGAVASLGATIYQDYHDDGQIFNGSIRNGEYGGKILGGAIAGAGIGVATTLGMGVGASVFGETILTVMGANLSFGTVFSIGVGTAATAGGLSYLAESWVGRTQVRTQELITEAWIGSFYGGIGFIVGLAGGATGFRPLSVMKNPSKVVIRSIVEGVFIWPMKSIISILR